MVSELERLPGLSTGYFYLTSGVRVRVRASPWAVDGYFYLTSGVQLERLPGLLMVTFI